MVKSGEVRCEWRLPARLCAGHPLKEALSKRKTSSTIQEKNKRFSSFVFAEIERALTQNSHENPSKREKKYLSYHKQEKFSSSWYGKKILPTKLPRSPFLSSLDNILHHIATPRTQPPPPREGQFSEKTFNTLVS